MGNDGWTAKVATRRGMKMIGIIVARSKNNVIGKNGKIPWKIKGEQSQFKELTIGNVVVMGRKSYEEIGHPLADRMNIVVSTTASYSGENLLTVKTLKEAIEYGAGKDVFIAGGYRLFKEAIPFVDKMYITEIDINIEDGDVFFPDFIEDDFQITVGDSGGDTIKYTRTEYRRKNSVCI